MSKSISLNGIWRVDLPGYPAGLEIPVPGCWENITDKKDIGGPVRVFRSFAVPSGYESATIRFSGVSYYCDVYVNGRNVGSHEGIWDGFDVDISGVVQFDGDNELELLIWKPGYHETDRFPLRQVLCGFIPDVCSTYGGIWDNVTLELSGKVFISELYAEGGPDGNVKVSAKIVNHADTPVYTSCKIRLSNGTTPDMLETPVMLEAKREDWHIFTMNATSPRAWSPRDPFLYSCSMELSEDRFHETATCRFGLREIRTEGAKILLNNDPVYLRGILHWGYYDDLIAPNPSREVIEEEIRKIRRHGFNMIKHCLYIPREAYLDAADEAGLLIWVELPLWLPEATPLLAGRIMREYPRILEALAGHPSVVLLSLGCELDDSVGSADLEKMYHMAKKGSTALVRDNSGSGECYGGLAVDFADYSDYHFYADLHHMENLMETFTPGWRNLRPWLFGEFCDIDTLRSLPKVRDQKGVQQLWWEVNSPETNPLSVLKTDFQLDTQDIRAEKYGISADSIQLRQLSLNHAMAHRKMTLELTRAFPEIGGYVITSLRDVPIATSGILDDALQPKFDTDRFRQFNEDLILVPAWDLTRTWINGDRVMNRERFNFFSGSPYGLHVLASNYSDADLVNASVCWKLINTHGEEVTTGTAVSSSSLIRRGTVQELCRIHIMLPHVEDARAFILSVEMTDGTSHSNNQWPIFIYPKPTFPDGIAFYDPLNVLSEVLARCGARELADGEAPGYCVFVATTRLTPEILKWTAEGGKVFHMQRGNGRLPVRKISFWREGLIQTFDHPVMKNLGKAWMDDLRYFSLATDTAFDTFAFDGTEFGRANPVIRRIDCRENTASDYMVEIPYGKGRIIATTLRFEGGTGRQPISFEHNCLALYLFGGIAEYLTRM